MSPRIVEAVREATTAARMRQSWADYARTPIQVIVGLVWSELHGPAAALEAVPAVIPTSEERRSDLDRALQGARKHLATLQAEQEELRGCAPESWVVARATALPALIAEAQDDLESVERILPLRPWPSDDEVKAGLAAVAQVALEEQARIVAAALEQSLERVRVAAAQVRQVLANFEATRAAVEAATERNLTTWAWSTEDRRLLDAVASLHQVRTEPRERVAA